MHERLLAQLKTSATLFADETTAPVLDSGRGKTKTVSNRPKLTTTERGTEMIRRVRPMSTRAIARTSGRSHISTASEAAWRIPML